MLQQQRVKLFFDFVSETIEFKNRFREQMQLQRLRLCSQLIININSLVVFEVLLIHNIFLTLFISSLIKGLPVRMKY